VIPSQSPTFATNAPLDIDESWAVTIGRSCGGDAGTMYRDCRVNGSARWSNRRRGSLEIGAGEMSAIADSSTADSCYNGGMTASRLRPSPRRAIAAKLGRNSRLGLFCSTSGRLTVEGPLSREERWGSDGASLESVSAFSHDPIGYRGGRNLYEYCGDGPVNRTDPLGLVELPFPFDPGELGRFIPSIPDWLNPQLNPFCRRKPLPAKPHRHCELAEGPIITAAPWVKGAKPITTITATEPNNGTWPAGVWVATFHEYASFVNNPATGADCACCEVRKWIKWTAGALPHSGFDGLSDGVYYEDQTPLGASPGHRDRPGSGEGDNYYDPDKTCNRAGGCVFRSSDDPNANFDKPAMKTAGTWTFVLTVVDVCPGNGGAQVGKDSNEVTVHWPGQTKYKSSN
jgi:hypothetical protein